MSDTFFQLIMVDTIAKANELNVPFFAMDSDRVFCLTEFPNPANGWDNSFFLLCGVDDSTGRRPLCEHEVDVLRFECEMRAYAVLSSETLSLDVLDSWISLTWSRYFGTGHIPSDFTQSIFPSVERAKERGLIYICSSQLTFVDPKSLINWPIHHLFDIVAEIMLHDWYNMPQICSIPFVYPNLLTNMRKVGNQIGYPWITRGSFLRKGRPCLIERYSENWS